MLSCSNALNPKLGCQTMKTNNFNHNSTSVKMNIYLDVACF